MNNYYESIGMNQQTTAWTKLALPEEAIGLNEQMERFNALLGLLGDLQDRSR